MILRFDSVLSLEKNALNADPKDLSHTPNPSNHPYVLVVDEVVIIAPGVREQNQLPLRTFTWNRLINSVNVDAAYAEETRLYR